jgi:hypothetical protein
MAPRQPRPTDATGVARAKEIKKNEVELKRRAEEISTIAAQEAFENETLVFDPSVNNEEVLVVDEVLDPAVMAPTEDDVEVTDVSLADDMVIVRLVADIPTMVYGAGKEYSFVAGRKYRVEKDLAGHLESIGYLYL